MKAIKKIVAAAVAVVSIGAIGVTASAETTILPLPASWMAVYQSGAPSSVNKPYEYTVEGRTKGYTVECTFFNGGNGAVVKVTPPRGTNFNFTRKDETSYYVSGSTTPDDFVFSALGSSANVTARGTIEEAK